MAPATLEGDGQVTVCAFGRGSRAVIYKKGQEEEKGRDGKATYPSADSDCKEGRPTLKPAAVPPYADADSWISFAPNVIIDARLGALWRVHLSLSDLTTAMADKVRSLRRVELQGPPLLSLLTSYMSTVPLSSQVGLVDALLRRHESKELLMGVLVEELLQKRDLSVAAKVLELVTSANSSVRSRRCMGPVRPLRCPE